MQRALPSDPTSPATIASLSVATAHERVNAIAARTSATEREKTKGALMLLRLLVILALAAALSAGDKGVLIDPNGATANLDVDKGGGIDPNGGGAMDPNG